MSTTNIPGGKGRPARKADNFTAPSVSLNISQPYGPPRPVAGIALPFTVKTTRIIFLKTQFDIN
jgi:hypothetical protein